MKTKISYRKMGYLFVFILFSMILGSTNVLAQGVGEEQLIQLSQSPVELKDERSEYSRTYFNPDGSFTVEMSTSPLFYEEKSGVFSAVNPTVYSIAMAEKDAPKEYQIEKAIYNCIFHSVAQGYSLNYRNYELTAQPIGVENVEADTFDNVIYYQNAWESTDLFYEIEADHIKERIVINTKYGEPIYRFKFILPMGSEVVETDEGLEIYVEENRIYHLPSPFVYDQGMQEPDFDVINYSYLLDGQELELMYIIDEDWFLSEERVFPVTIDPTVQITAPKSVAINIDADQTAHYECYNFMTQVVKTYASNRFRIKLGDNILVEETLPNTFFGYKKEHKTGTVSLKANHQYLITHSVGNGWSPFRLYYGEGWSKVTYYKKPIANISKLDGTIFSVPPNLEWRLTYETGSDFPQKNFMIYLSQNEDHLQALPAPTETKVSEDDYHIVCKSTNTGYSLENDPEVNKMKEGEWFYRVAVYNGGVWSDWGSSDSFVLDQTGPSFEDLSITIANINSDQIEVSWASALDQWSGSVTYLVQLEDIQTGVTRNISNEKITEKKITIDGLSPNRFYRVLIYAFDGVGNQSTAITKEFNTKPEIVINGDMEFEQANGTYIPKVVFTQVHAYAYKIKVNTTNNEEFFESDWILSGSSGVIKDVNLLGVYLDRETDYELLIGSANQEEYESAALWEEIRTNTVDDSIHVPNAAPDKPISIYPVDGSMIKPTGENMTDVIISSNPTQDYENDHLAYLIEIYEVRGPLPETVDDIAEDPDFISYCQTIFDEQYSIFLEDRILNEYQTETIETLDYWLDMMEIQIPDPGEGDDNVLHSANTPTAVSGPGIDDPDPTPDDPDPVPDDPDPIPTETYIQEKYTYEEYYDLVYTIQAEYYEDEYFQNVMEDSFEEYVNENLTDDAYTLIDAKTPVENQSGELTTTFNNFEDGKTYSWRIKATENLIQSDYRNTVYSDFSEFTIKCSGPEPPTFTISGLSSGFTRFKELAIEDITYDAETVTLQIKESFLSPIDIPLSNSYHYVMDDREGERIIQLIAFDSIRNESTSVPYRVIYDLTPPVNPNMSQFSVTELDQKIEIEWEPGSDEPFVENISNIQYYLVTVTKSTTSFDDDSHAKTFYFDVTDERKLTLENLAPNEEIQIEMRIRDQAGHYSATTQPLTVYPRPEVSTLINPRSTENQVSNGDGTVELYLRGQEVAATAYQIQYRKSGEETWNYTTIETFPAWTLTVDANSTYFFQVHTYNSLEETEYRTPAKSWSEQITIDIYNHPPTVPTLSVPEFINDDPVHLSSAVATDLDQNNLTYYHIIEGDGQLIKESTTVPEIWLSQLENGGSYTWTLGVSDGHSFDASGQEQIFYSSPVSFTIDRTPPQLWVDPISTENYIHENFVSIEAEDPLSGLEEIIYRWLTLDENGEIVIAQGSIQSGDQIIAPEGEYTLEIVATDRLGNTSEYRELYKVDTTKPTIQEFHLEAVTGESGYLHDSSMIPFTFTVSEDQSKLTGFSYAFIPTGTLPENVDKTQLIREEIAPEHLSPASTGGYTLTKRVTNPTLLESGCEYYFYLEVENEAGLSTSYYTTDTLIVDNTRPDISEFQLSGVEIRDGLGYVNQSDNLHLSLAVDDPESGVQRITYELLDGKAKQVMNSFSTFTDLKTEIKNLDTETIEEIQIQIRATNSLGLISTQISKPFIYDPDEPVLKYLQVGCDPTLEANEPYRQKNNQYLDLRWHITDTTGLASIVYSIGTTPGGKEVSILFSEADSGWLSVGEALMEQQIKVYHDDQGFDDGTYYVTLKVTDLAGNTATFTTNPVIIDSSKLLAPVISIPRYLTNVEQLPVNINFSADQEVEKYMLSLYRVESENASIDLLRSEEYVTDATNYTINFVHDFIQGDRYQIKVEAVLNSGESVGSWSQQILVDQTPPFITNLEVPEYSTSDALKVRWTAKDQDYEAESQDLKYALRLGYSYGGSEIQDWQEVDVNQFIFSDFVINDGSSVFVSLRVTNPAGLVTEVYSEPIIIDNTAPPVPQVAHLYGLYTAQQNQLEYQWEIAHDRNLDHFEVVVSNTPLASENVNWINVGVDTSYVYNDELINGTPYYLLVRAYGKNGLYSEGVSSVVNIDYTKPDIVRIRDYQIYAGETNSLSVDLDVLEPESVITQISYAVGTVENPEAIKAYFWETFTPKSTSLTVEGAYEIGETYYFYVQLANAPGQVSDIEMSDGVTIIESSLPLVTQVYSPADYTNNNKRLDFTWKVNDTTLPYESFYYGLVNDPDHSPSEWGETSDLYCSITPENLISYLDDFDDGIYYLQVRCKNKLGIYSPTVVSDPIVIDTVRPGKPVLNYPLFIKDQLTFSGTTSTIGDSGIGFFEYGIGSEPGAIDILDWQTLQPNSDRFTVNTSLKRSHNSRFYLTARVKNNTNQMSLPQISQAVTVDRQSPTIPTISVPTYTNSLTRVENVSISSQDLLSGIIGYRWQIVREEDKELITKLESEEIALDGVTEEMDLNQLVLRTEISQDGNYFIGVQTKDSVGNWSPIGWSDTVLVDTTAPAIHFTESNPEILNEPGVIDYQTDEAGLLEYWIYQVPEIGDPKIQANNSMEIQAGTGSINFPYTEPGIYQIQIRQRDIYGHLSIVKQWDLRVNAKPVVYFNPDAVEVYYGENFSPILFAEDADGSQLTYDWVLSLNDEIVQSNSTTTPIFTYQFKELGEYYLDVNVRDGDGGETSGSMTIEVVPTLEGTLILNEIWSSNQTVRGDVIVPPGLKLIIDSGSRISFPEDVVLIIHGELELQGTVESLVTLQGSSEEYVDHLRWKGIRIESDGLLSTSSHYYQISGAERGLILLNQQENIGYGIFKNNRLGIHIVNGSPQITNCQFWKNELFGIKEEAQTMPTISNCGFGENGQADYYEADYTWQWVDEINEFAAHMGNYKLEGGVNPW